MHRGYMFNGRGEAHARAKLPIKHCMCRAGRYRPTRERPHLSFAPIAKSSLNVKRPEAEESRESREKEIA